MAKFFKDSEIVGLKDNLIKSLDNLRQAAGIPIIITSGYRSPEHSVEVGGYATDSHTKGLAADIQCNDDMHRYTIIKAAMVAGIERIGIGKGHIHIDLDTTKESPCLWTEPGI